MRIFLIHNGLDIYASQQEKYDLVINIASGHANFDYIVDWLKKHVDDKNSR
jgi:death-on-curing protein